MTSPNPYEDSQTAEAYSKLEFHGTYYLAFRDLPEIISKHVVGSKALDFGCGAGRSTRFLAECGLNATGVDISEDMIRHAQTIDPEGDYRLIANDKLGVLSNNSFDLILAAYPFDNIPSMENKVEVFAQLSPLLDKNGKLIIIVSTPEIYTNEWVSFTTQGFEENSNAKTGDEVRVSLKDFGESEPVTDILWSREDYEETFRQSKLRLIESYTPLGTENDPYDWIVERSIAPWSIYVLANS
jgi:SAM-dependent methyltransferase